MKVVSWNIKGLRSPQKRWMVLRQLKKLKSDIALLQETHLDREDFGRMEKLWVGQVLGSPAIKKKAGILLLLNEQLNCQVLSHKSDNKGRGAHVVLQVQETQYSVYSVYGSSSSNAKFFTEYGNCYYKTNALIKL